MLSTLGTRFAFPLVALVLFGAFLFLLYGLAKAAARTTDPGGERRRGCLEGCGLAVVLAFLCLLGTGAFVALVAVALGVAAVEHNPVRSIEVRRLDPLQARSTRSSELACLTFELEGDAGWLVDLIEDLFDVEEDELWLVRRTEFGPAGETLTLVDIYLPLDARELHEVEEEIRRELPRLSGRVDPRFPEGVRIEFRGASLPR